MAVLYDNSGKIIQIGGVNEIWDNSGLVYKYQKPAPTHDYSQDYLTFEAISAGTFSCTSACSYSMDDGATWTALAANTSTPTVNAGDKILFKATNTPTNMRGIGDFSATADFNAMGNPYSMFSGDSFTAVTTLPEYSSSSMFSGNTHLVSAEHLSLPAETLGDGCYEWMFMGCTSLTTAPELPATSLARACYLSMFYGCTSLATAPALPATILELQCYNSMFYGCTSLATAPELPASELANFCYQAMFQGCTSLATAPALSATTLVNGCYSTMYINCTSLNYIKMLATDISATGCLAGWVNGVASTGTFVKAASMTSLPSGTSGIPDGWTVVDAT